ncbi:MAG: hypothetical protein ACI9EF_003873 [Pseudohongiellaceae bacterium]|jgi:hypothetical protein
MADEPRPGLLGFLADTWIWILAPLVLAIIAVVALMLLSEGDAQSPFLYNEF